MVDSPSTPRSAPTLVALFAGAGGLDLGFEQAGFRTILASDIQEVAEETFRINRPDIPFICKDVQKITIEQILELTGGVKPDVVIGGPPCQGFSTLGDKLSADPRNSLFEAFARIVEGLEPRAVVIENVKAITTMYGGRFKRYVIDRFKRAGYDMRVEVLNAASYGVPQTRHRAFFVGFKGSATGFNFPKPTHGPGEIPFATVGQAFEGLEGRENELPNHVPLNHSEKVIKRYQLIPEGGKLPSPDQLPEDIKRKNFGNTYKRLHRERPSLTMVPGNNAFPVHPTLNRSLTPREAARLQTFSDDYVFAGDRRRQCILVGNAVPPLMGSKIGEAVRRHLDSDFEAESPDAPDGLLPFLKGKRKKHDFLHIESLSKLPVSRGFVDLFSGAGGITIGLARAGLRPLCGADFNKNARATHESSYPGVPFVFGDLSKTSVQNEVLEVVGDQRPMILAGGPPCQGFSIFGKRRFVNSRDYEPREDPRNSLVFAFVDMAAKLMPRWVIMENVPGMLNLDDGWFVERVEDELRAAGFDNVEHRVLNAAHYGVPQQRKRLLIVANRTGHVIPWPKRKFFEQPSEWQDPFRTVGEVITDLASPESYDRFTCHVPMKHKPKTVERYKYIPEGGRLDVEALTAELQKGYRTKRVSNYSHIFRRLHREEASITLVPGHNAFPIHPWLNRALTVREAARIQTFPDDVEFKGSRQEQCIQVGNAFPPLVAELLGNAIVKAETNKWYPGQIPKSALYSMLELEEPEPGELREEISGEQAAFEFAG